MIPSPIVRSSDHQILMAIDRLEDGSYEFESRRTHAWNKIEWHVPKNLRGKFLDVGCGPGNGVIAALQHNFEMAVGIDINLKEFGFNLNFEQLALMYDVSAKKGLLIEADIFETHFNPQTFDCVLMLDSVEHVPAPEKFVSYGANNLAPGGVMLIDTCPLYYSKHGAHLFNHFSAETHPWIHLRHDFHELVEQRSVDDWSLERQLSP